MVGIAAIDNRYQNLITGLFQGSGGAFDLYGFSGTKTLISGMNILLDYAY